MKSLEELLLEADENLGRLHACLILGLTKEAISYAVKAHVAVLSAQQSFAPDSLKAGVLSLPDVVIIENVLPAEGG